MCTGVVYGDCWIIQHRRGRATRVRVGMGCATLRRLTANGEFQLHASQRYHAFESTSRRFLLLTGTFALHSGTPASSCVATYHVLCMRPIARWTPTEPYEHTCSILSVRSEGSRWPSQLRLPSRRCGSGEGLSIFVRRDGPAQPRRRRRYL